MRESQPGGPLAAKRPSAYRRTVLAAVGLFLLAALAITGFFFAATEAMGHLVRNWSQERGASVQSALERMRDSLAVTLRDYSVWDDAYDFALSPDPAWAEENLDWLIQERMAQAVAVMDREGRLLYRNGAFTTWPASDGELVLTTMSTLLTGSPTAQVLLYRPEEDALYWLAASRIVHSSDESLAGDYAGFFVFARLIGPQDLAFIESVTGVSGIRVVDSSSMGPDPGYSHGHILLRDYLGPPGLAITYDVPVPMAGTMAARLRLGTVLSLAAVFLTLAASLGVTYRLIVRPFRALADAANRFAQKGVWSPAPQRHQEFWALSDTLTQAIEKRLAAEERERRHADEQRLLLDNLPAYVFFKDRDGHYVTVNRKMAELLGLPESQIAGKTDQDLFPLETAEQLRRNDSEVLRSGHSLEVEEMVIVGDRRIATQALKVPLRDQSGQIVGLVGMVFDLTERRRLEEALHQSQKLEAVGQLAGSVAHDFNNILTSIMGGVDLALQQLPPTHPLAAELDEVRQSAERAAQITRQLLFLSRAKSAEKRPLGANEVVSSLGKMLRRFLGEDIALELDLSPRSPIILADRTQIEQVLLNLAINARDAMPSGGTLTVRTEVVDMDGPLPHPLSDRGEGRLPLPALREGGLGGLGSPSLLLTVADTGSGIDPELKVRIFEPFFTTKKDSGTGLGLSVVQSIVREHQGELWFNSELGRGTTFYIAIPLEREPAARGNGRSARPLPRGSESVVVVEDDEVVRQLTERILASQGYRVVTASGADEAWALVGSPSQPPDLLLSDVIMTGMNGYDLAHSLLARQPSLKVLLTSGYSHSAIAARGLSPNGFRILPKPYTPAALACAVRETLDE